MRDMTLRYEVKIIIRFSRVRSRGSISHTQSGKHENRYTHHVCDSAERTDGSNQEELGIDESHDGDGAQERPSHDRANEMPIPFREKNQAKRYDEPAETEQSN